MQLIIPNRYIPSSSIWVASTFFTMAAQRFLSVAISGLMPWMRMSPFSLSRHLIFGRPLGRVPVTVVLSVLLVM